MEALLLMLAGQHQFGMETLKILTRNASEWMLTQAIQSLALRANIDVNVMLSI